MCRGALSHAASIEHEVAALGAPRWPEPRAAIQTFRIAVVTGAVITHERENRWALCHTAPVQLEINALGAVVLGGAVAAFLPGKLWVARFVTVLTLAVVPALYSLLFNFGRPRKPSASTPEPTRIAEPA